MCSYIPVYNLNYGKGEMRAIRVNICGGC